MSLIDEFSRTVIWLIRAGATFRVCYCFFRLIMADEDAPTYKKRAKNTLLFYVIAECIWVIKKLIIDYYA